MEVNKVLIICPVSAVGTWEEEIPKHCAVPHRVYTLSKAKEADDLKFLAHTDYLTFVIVTYDVAKNIVSKLKGWSPGGIICDESQYISIPSSQRSRALHRIGDLLDENKIIMSGTPILKSPLRIYSQYRFLDKTVFGTRHKDFLEEYAVMGGYMGYEVKGIRKPKKLAKKIKKLMCRASEKEAEKYLPKKQFIPIKFDLSDKCKRIYKKMAKHAVVEFKSGRISTAEVGAVKTMRFQQITGGFLKDEDGNYINIGDDKLRILDDLLESLEGHKIVIFARFKRDIRKIKALCKKRGLRPMVIKGGVSSKKREKIRKRFIKDESRKVVIMQIRAATSVDLSISNRAIYYSMDFSPENFVQSQGRIRRRNQKNPCFYYVLMARNTVDESIYHLLQKEINLSELILDRYEEILGGTIEL